MFSPLKVLPYMVSTTWHFHSVNNQAIQIIHKLHRNVRIDRFFSATLYNSIEVMGQRSYKKSSRIQKCTQLDVHPSSEEQRNHLTSFHWWVMTIQGTLSHHLTSSTMNPESSHSPKDQEDTEQCLSTQPLVISHSLAIQANMTWSLSIDGQAVTCKECWVKLIVKHYIN